MVYYRNGIAWFIIICLVVTGCTAQRDPIIRSDRVGSLAIHAAMPMNMMESAQSLELILMQDGQVRRLNVPYEDDTATVTVDRLYEGVWNVVLQLRDLEDDITHRAAGNVNIFGEQSTLTELLLEPQPGTLEVYIDLSAREDIDQIHNARLLISPGGYTSGAREEGSTTIFISRSYKPQTYDYSIALYRDGFNSGHHIYTSPWQPITISPGKTTTFVWAPSTGDLELIGDILPMPDQPTHFTVEHRGNGRLRFTWATGDPLNSLDGYRLYARTDHFSVFTVIEELPPDVFELELDVPLPDDPITYAYALAAFTHAGYESPRSDTVEITLPAAASY